MRKLFMFVFLLLIAGFGIYSCRINLFFFPGTMAAYLLLMIFPGASLYLLVEKNPRPLELILSSIVLSPVLVGLAAVTAMGLGLSSKTTVLLISSVFAAMGFCAFFLGKSFRTPAVLSHKQTLMLTGIIAAFCILAGYHPFSDEWWRLRSDAWFHAAVVAQTADYGIPPEDPYFYGMSLQYMWFYHVLVLVLSKAANISPLKVMPLLNIQALAGFSLASFLLSIHFRKRFMFGISSMLTAVLGLNALFWLFLPVKIVPAFVGKMRGWSEVTRILSLTPFNIETAREFVRFANSQVFFLDKFIVSTAFSLGLCFMAAAWYALVSGLSRPRVYSIVFVFIVTIGMVAFHTIVGLIMVTGFTGGLILLQFRRSHFDRPISRSSLLFILALLAGTIILSPYLYLVTHGKESEHLLPLGFSFSVMISIFVSCALGFLLSAFQVKRLIYEQTHEECFFVFAALSVFFICLVIRLPVVNAYDKLSFFVFYPLAIAGGWTLAELPMSSNNFLRKRSVIVLIFVLLFLPLTLIQMFGCFATPTPDFLTTPEKKVASWVRANTPREAVFLDSKDRVFLLVTGPRRYYWGKQKYANLWGYDMDEMNRRRCVRDNLYDSEVLNKETLRSLGEIDVETYAIARENEQGISGSEKFIRNRDFFQEVFTAGPLTVFKVNRDNCRRAAGPE